MKRYGPKTAFLFGSLVLGSGAVLGAADPLYSYTVTVGTDASANIDSVLFDGTHIWAGVQGQNGGSVKKLSVSGAVISTTPVGSAPLEMAYDGARIWVTGYTSSDITVVAANGVVVKRIALSANANPEGILFDGKYMWVANNGAGANTVSKYNPRSMTLISDYTVGNDPDGLAFDGTYVWVTNSNSNNVMKLDRETGRILRTYPTGPFPLSMVFDGKSIWIGNGADASLGPPSNTNITGSLTKLRAYGGVNLGTFPVGSTVRGLAFDGTSIWICNSKDNTLTRLRAADGARLGTYRTGASPRSMAFDGKRMWIANSGDNTLTVVASSPHPIVSGRPVAGRGGVFTARALALLAPIETVVDSSYSGPIDDSPMTPEAVGLIVNTLLGDN